MDGIPGQRLRSIPVLGGSRLSSSGREFLDRSEAYPS
jgi:hypothetical protein